VKYDSELIPLEILLVEALDGLYNLLLVADNDKFASRMCRPTTCSPRRIHHKILDSKLLVKF